MSGLFEARERKSVFIINLVHLSLIETRLGKGSFGNAAGCPKTKDWPGKFRQQTTNAR